jgi:N-acetylmuramoyl-L-alanine amidase
VNGDAPPGVPEGSILPPPSIHQIEDAAHRGLVIPEIPLLYTTEPELLSTPQVNRTVFGFLPYWVASSLTHVRWDLLTHVAYFDVPLNSDGTLGTTAWPSGAYVQALLNTAHANGVKVVLSATNFSSSGIGTLLGSPTYRQNAIDNLLAKVQEGSGDGVNIDLEGVPVAQKANLVVFMTGLASAFHAAVPGSHVSICTPAVDWSNAFDYDQLALSSDGLFIMGYDYHWSGSTTAGPVAQLTGWGTYNVTWTVNDYLTYGGTANRGKFLLGVPYYGYDWPTTSTSVPSSTTATGTSKTYNMARGEAGGYGRQWNTDGQVPYYTYTSTSPHQCWYDDAESLGLKWDLVNAQDLGGTGMWALNYDTADDELWNKIEAEFTAPPADLAGVKICVDPGHGGSDPGAVGPTLLEEADVNLAVGLMLRDALEAREASLYMTRTTDTTVTLTARTDYANSIPADRFESVHHNASGTPSANYTGVHIYDNGTGSCPASADSKDMAGKTALRLETVMGLDVVSSNCSTPIHGVHGDDFYVLHYTAMPAMLTEASFISNPDEEALLRTDVRRCTETGAIAKGVEDHYGVAASDAPCAAGTCANPIVVPSLPYTDSNSTLGRAANMNAYSCAPSTNEAGPEVIYQFTITGPGVLTALVTESGGSDIDPHLLSSCSPSFCLARDNTTFSHYLTAGTYYISCDTWTSSGGTQYAGPYTLDLSFVPDTTPPASVTGLRWNGSGSWVWDAVTHDASGGLEGINHYEVYRSTSASVTGTLKASPVSTSWPDPANPSSGCWYYSIRAVDEAGFRDAELIVDNPAAAFAGTWSTGTSSPDKYGSDYRFVGTGGTGTKTATWTFTPAESGLYDVSVYYPQGGNRSAASRFTVTHAQGPTLHTVNQQSDGGAWNLLGRHRLNGGTPYTVVLDDAEAVPGFVVIADAVRWSRTL